MQRSMSSKEKSNITHSSPRTRGGAAQGCRGNARVCQEAEARARGELGAVAFVGESLGNTRQGRGSILGLETLNNFSGLWGTGEIPSCLVPGPRMIQAEECCLLVGMARWSRRALYWLLYKSDMLPPACTLCQSLSISSAWEESLSTVSKVFFSCQTSQYTEIKT